MPEVIIDEKSHENVITRESTVSLTIGLSMRTQHSLSRRTKLIKSYYSVCSRKFRLLQWKVITSYHCFFGLTLHNFDIKTYHRFTTHLNHNTGKL